MSYSIKIISVIPDTNNDTGERFLDVLANILDESGELVASKRLGYPIDTTEEGIREELAGVLRAYVADVEYNNSAAGQKSKEVEQQNKHADTLAKSLVGEEIT